MYNNPSNTTNTALLPVTILTDPTEGSFASKKDKDVLFAHGPTVPFSEKTEEKKALKKASKTRLARCLKSLEETTDKSVLETASGPVRFLNEAAAQTWAQSAAAQKRITQDKFVPAATPESTPASPLAKALYAPRPETSSTDLAAKAFHTYMVEGESALGAKAMHLTRDEEGGFVIPSFLQDQITARLRVLCPLRFLAHVQSVRNDTTQFMIQDQERPVAAWMRPGELRAAPVFHPKFRPISLNVIYVRALASQKRLDDLGEGMEEWLITHLSQALARCENRAFVRGTGRQQPLGLLRCVQGFVDNTPEEPVENEDTQEAQPAAQGEALLENRPIEALTTRVVTADVLLQMVGALETDYLANASWLMSRSALFALQRLQDNAGHFLWQPSLSLGAPSSLLGYPVYVSDDLSSATEANGVPIVFGDFKEAYTIVERGLLSLMRDPFTAKPYVEFYTTHTVGGSVVNPEALKGLRIEE